jgi:hypothetical protein
LMVHGFATQLFGTFLLDDTRMLQNEIQVHDNDTKSWPMTHSWWAMTTVA